MQRRGGRERSLSGIHILEMLKSYIYEGEDYD
jgi:hypothetical protein